MYGRIVGGTPKRGRRIRARQASPLHARMSDRSKEFCEMATATTSLTTQDTEFLRQLAAQLRVDSIRCSTEAGSGHPTSSMSAADIVAGLLARHFLYDWEHPQAPTNDHLIYSKGHPSPLRYAMFKAA